MGDQGPNATLYVSNLPDNLNKEVLKASLKAIVSAVAPPLDIVVMSTMRLRGQAWVVFTDVTSATNVLTHLQGFPFFDKPMKLQYARSESDATAKFQGRAPNKGNRKQKRDTSQGQQQLAGKPAAGAPAAATKVRTPLSGSAEGIMHQSDTPVNCRGAWQQLFCQSSAARELPKEAGVQQGGRPAG